MNTAFIGLDYIIDIMHPDGKIARSATHAEQRNIIGKANHALTIAAAKGWLSVLVKVGFNPLHHDQSKQSPGFGRAHQLGAMKLGAYGTEFHPELNVTDNQLIIIKSRISAFYRVLASINDRNG